MSRLLAVTKYITWDRAFVSGPKETPQIPVNTGETGSNDKEGEKTKYNLIEHFWRSFRLCMHLQGGWP